MVINRPIGEIVILLTWHFIYGALNFVQIFSATPLDSIYHSTHAMYTIS